MKIGIMGYELESHILQCDIYISDKSSQTLEGVPYTISTPANEHMGKFARLAQASHLLSRVFRHVCDNDATKAFLDQEKMLIDRALRSLLSLTVAEEELCGLAYCSPVALLSRYAIFSMRVNNADCGLRMVISSALLLLHSYNPTRCRRNGVDIDQGYLAAIEVTSKVIMPISTRLKDQAAAFSHRTFPLVLDWMYRSVVSYSIVPQASPIIDIFCVETVKEAIKELSRQWSVGGTVSIHPTPSFSPINRSHF